MPQRGRKKGKRRGSRGGGNKTQEASDMNEEKKVFGSANTVRRGGKIIKKRYRRLIPTSTCRYGRSHMGKKKQSAEEG